MARQPKKQDICYRCGKPGHFARDYHVQLSDSGAPKPNNAQVKHVLTEQLPLPPVESIANSLKN